MFANSETENHLQKGGLAFVSLNVIFLEEYMSCYPQRLCS